MPNPYCSKLKPRLLPRFVSRRGSARRGLIGSFRVPQVYYVTPNPGRVEPGQSVEVQCEPCATRRDAPRVLNSSLHTLCVGETPVMQQAMKEEPPPGARCKDKFLIQSTIITPEMERLSPYDSVSPPLSDPLSIARTMFTFT